MRITALLAIVGFAVTLMAATAAVTLDRRFQQKDIRRDLYLDWLSLMDSQRLLVEDALRDPAKQGDVVRSFHRNFYSIAARMELLAPKDVQAAAFDYYNAQTAATKAAQAARVDLSTLFQQLRELPERDLLVTAMRKDLRSRWPRRHV